MTLRSIDSSAQRELLLSFEPAIDLTEAARIVAASVQALLKENVVVLPCVYANATEECRAVALSKKDRIILFVCAEQMRDIRVHVKELGIPGGGGTVLYILDDLAEYLRETIPQR